MRNDFNLTLFLAGCGMVLFAGCSDDDGRALIDSSVESDAGSDSGGTDSGLDATPGVDAGADAVPVSDVGVDAAPVSDAGADAARFPSPAYDGDGCLTFASAQEICGSASNDLACTAVAACSLSTQSQCQIDCEMATTLCIDSVSVDACLAAIDGSCADLSACGGWLHFPE